MKKVLATITILLLALFTLSCTPSVPKDQHEQLQTEYQTLKTNITQLETDYEQLQTKHQSLQEELTELKDELQKYRDTGIRVYDSVRLPKVLKYSDLRLSRQWFDSDYINLTNNSNASNPTFDQLIDFLESDDTDQYSYEEGYFSGRVCGWFAERLHNNAEKANIKAALVIINFVDKWSGHALNAFNTTDQGLVFIDCTGKKFDPFLLPIYSPFTITYKIGDTGSHDTIAYPKVKNPLGWININMPYGLEYSEYERWQKDVEGMREKFNSVPDSKLSQVTKESNSNLGSFFKPSDEVESIEIYW